MSQLCGVWNYQRKNDPSRAEIRLQIITGSRRPFEAALIVVDHRNVLTFPQRETFESAAGALQFVRERNGHLSTEGWSVTGREGLASDLDLHDHSSELIPDVSCGVVDGIWTYRLAQDGSFAQIRIQVALTDTAPYRVSSHEFDTNFAPCPAVERSMRYGRQSEAIDFMRAEARALARQGWELIGAVGLARGIDLLENTKAIRLPSATLATQEAIWEFQDTLTGEGFKAELLVHCDRDFPFEVLHFKRRPSTTRWYAVQGGHHFQDHGSAMEAVRRPILHLTRTGYELTRSAGLGEGIHPADKHHDLQFRLHEEWAASRAALG